jgi:apolipoprotein N-acyltransferase
VVPALLSGGGAASRGRAAPSRPLPLALFAIAAGGLWGACFQAHAWPGLAFVALGPLLLLLAVPAPCAPRRALWVGWLHGTVAWWVQVPWIAATIYRYGGLPLWAALLLVLLLCAYLGAYHAAFCYLGVGLLRRGGAVALGGLPALWVSLEWVRGVLFSGFPWNLTGNALLEVPGALALAPWVGVYGLSFLVVLVNASWAVAVAERRRGLLAGAAAAGLLLAVAWAGARERPAPATRSVALVQPATGVVLDPGSPEVARGYERLLGLSRCPEPGALLVWPESAAWPYAWQGNEHLRRDLGAIAAQGCSVLFNTSIWDGDAVYNSALLLAPDGTLQRYDKNHLVPFGEYVPLGDLLPWVSQLARAAGSYDAADEATLLEWDGERLGLSICFEITMPGQVAERARSGATMLVTLTNDAWFGDTSAPWQHLAAARLRAAENRRPVLRAAITGISAMIDERGRVVRQLAVGDAGVIEAGVAGQNTLTPFSRAPWAVPAACGVAALTLILSSSRRNHDRRGSPATARPGEDAPPDPPGVSLTVPSSNGS